MPELAAIRSACSRSIESHVSQQHHSAKAQAAEAPQYVGCLTMPK